MVAIPEISRSLRGTYGKTRDLFESKFVLSPLPSPRERGEG